MGKQLQQCFKGLKQLLGERFTTQPGVLREHGRGEAFYPDYPPEAVIYPLSTEEVSSAVKLCARHMVPMVPYGAGTSLEGHCLAVAGGVCFDFSRMNKIVRLSVEDLDCSVQPGVTRKQLNSYLRETGLMFPIDPGADATLGGMIATNASGTNAVRYGAMKDMVINLTVVTPRGDIVKTANRAKKSAAGYDLTRLFVGSEGTLGLVTEATLKLFGIPEVVVAGIIGFESLGGAVNTVISTIQHGLAVARIELLDSLQIKALNRYFHTRFPEQPTLWFEFGGSGVDQQLAVFYDLVQDNRGVLLETAETTEQRNKLWDMRHKLWHAALAYNPGMRGWSTDVCVPISKLADCITETQQDIADSGLFCPILGHVGDGNFHVLVMFNEKDPQQLETARELNRKVVDRALAMDGTCTGEHGIGIGKIDKLARELPSALPLMKAVKQALDPDNLMNPGKIFER